MAIFVVTHKEINFVFPEGYKSIVVNANKNKIHGDLFDNIGDNISNKNEFYCELTAIYWIWKNQQDDIIGIDHYRRFFILNGKYLSLEQAESILKTFDIILPKKDHFARKMGLRFWTTSGYRKDLKILRNVLIKLYPEYVKDYDKFMNQYDMYSYNMMIMSGSQFNDFCEWLFPILFEVEKYIDASKRHGYYKRLYGFLAERLTNIYVVHNNLKIKELSILYTGEKLSIKSRILIRLKKLIDKYRL